MKTILWETQLSVGLTIQGFIFSVCFWSTSHSLNFLKLPSRDNIDIYTTDNIFWNMIQRCSNLFKYNTWTIIPFLIHTDEETIKCNVDNSPYLTPNKSYAFNLPSEEGSPYIQTVLQVLQYFY